LPKLRFAHQVLRRLEDRALGCNKTLEAVRVQGVETCHGDCGMGEHLWRDGGWGQRGNWGTGEMGKCGFHGLYGFHQNIPEAKAVCSIHRACDIVEYGRPGTGEVGNWGNCLIRGSQELWTVSAASMFSSNITAFLKTRSLEEVTRFLNGPAGCIVLSGPQGSGKAALVTQAATAIGRSAKI
jgi:hypothetical protein